MWRRQKLRLGRTQILIAKLHPIKSHAHVLNARCLPPNKRHAWKLRREHNNGLRLCKNTFNIINNLAVNQTHFYVLRSRDMKQNVYFLVNSIAFCFHRIESAANRITLGNSNMISSNKMRMQPANSIK